MSDMGKLLLLLGGVIAVMGAVLLFAGKFNLPIGRLPGDFTWRGRNTTVYFPFATSIVISIVLSLVLWLIQRIRH
jgi:ribose/xylose/arabinose/galactoside ABC-type transport system permease subunit